MRLFSRAPKQQAAPPEPGPPAAVGPGHTTDRDDPALTHRIDEQPVSQATAYLVLSEEERAKGYVRPVRKTYRHKTCGGTTTMSAPLAETYARQPDFYGATYCAICRKHRPLEEFEWEDGTPVGS